MHKGKAAPHQMGMVILDAIIEIVITRPKAGVKTKQTVQIVNTIARTTRV